MIKYVFKDTPIALRNADKADAQKLGETLAKITSTHKGRLTPEDVVNAARDTKNPLHPHFEWNDKVAAQAYRLDQARSIIRLIRVDDASGEEPKPAYISVSDHGVAYRTMQEVASNRELQLMVLQQAERDLKAFERRYHMLNDVCTLVKQARDAVDAKRNELETRAAA